jgi:transposase-like protein
MTESTTDIVAPIMIGAISGLIISWGVGLIPALIYRYAIYKRPVPKDEVFSRLALPVTVLMFVFKLTIAGLTDSKFNANPLPWIIIYHIGKWIMTRTPRSKSLRSNSPSSVTREELTLGVSCTRCGFQLPKPDWRCPECYFEFEEKNEIQSEQAVEKHDQLAKMLSAAAGFRAAEIVNGKNFTNEQVRLYILNYTGKYPRQIVEAGIGVILMKRVNGDAPDRKGDPSEHVELTARQMASDPVFNEAIKRRINNDFKS